jgi:Uncharacterized protein conserved in bacteria
MSKSLSYLAAFLTGIVITAMVVCNTELGVRTNIEVSTWVNQIIAILLLSVLLLAGRKNEQLVPKREHLHWYEHFAGSIGIAIVMINYHTVLNIGATIAMAGTVFGQSFMGLIIDMTGFMKLPKRKTTKAKIISMIVCYAGIIIMSVFSGESAQLGYLMLSVLAGMLTMIQMGYNSRVAAKIGTFPGALLNVTTGFLTITLISFLFFRAESLEAVKNLAFVPFPLIIGGSVLGIVVVVVTNVVIPRIPAVYSALLLSSGQIITSLIFDALLYGRFTLSLFIGAIVMLMGLIYGAKDDISASRSSREG